MEGHHIHIPGSVDGGYCYLFLTNTNPANKKPPFGGFSNFLLLVGRVGFEPTTK